MTALGNPLLLQRMSEAINELRLLFAKFDTSTQTGLVTQEQFLKVYQQVFSAGEVEGRRLFEALDLDKDGRVDYVDWSNSLTIEELHTLTNQCRTKGPLSRAVLNEQERALVKVMRGRVEGLASLAASLGVRLMIDAEHFKFQPAIDNITTQLAKMFNRGNRTVIFSTYQMYLRDSQRRLDQDMRRARQGGYGFACKLVRGAYMQMERREAHEQGRPDPVHATLQDTHACYNQAVSAVISKVAAGDRVELMIASHNQQSVELALKELGRHNLDASAPVYFGTLLGMADHLSFSLGASRYKAYKYVPYGKINEVMPYLVRRAQENSGLLGGATSELKMIRSELKRRLFPASSSSSASGTVTSPSGKTRIAQ
jgi:proline dehydrogenase